MRAKANVTTKTIAVVLQGATSIPVEDIAQFPAPPNYATLINRATNEFETVTYTGILGDSLTGCIRGVEGLDREWDASTSVGRYFTAIEWNEMIDKLGVASVDFALADEIVALSKQLKDRDRRGVSTDIKPTVGVELGTTFYEADTCSIYEWVGTGWVFRIKIYN